MAKLERTSTPGIYRAHRKACENKDRCDCPYAILWRHRGKQHRETCRSFAEAREQKALRTTVDSRPASRARFGDYFPKWIETYAGLTSRGFSETTRPEYRRPIANYAMPKWKGMKLDAIEPSDVRELFAELRKEGKSTSAIKKLRAALSALFAKTAIEDGLVNSNPIRGVRIPTPLVDESPEKSGRRR